MAGAAQLTGGYLQCPLPSFAEERDGSGLAAAEKAAPKSWSDIERLSQINRNNYDLQRKGGPLCKAEDDGVRVGKLACLATVYTMIDRNSYGVKLPVYIDKFYPDPEYPRNGGKTDRATLPSDFKDFTVENEIPIDSSAIAAALDQREPIILKACRGSCDIPGVFQHFVLVVGKRQESTGQEKFMVDDPWPKDAGDADVCVSEKNGEHYELLLENDSVPYPYPAMKGVTFQKMRIVHASLSASP